MIENSRNKSDNGEKVIAIFMDLSEAFDTTNHSLLLAKLKAYGFSDQVLSLLQSYVCNRFQRMRWSQEWGTHLEGVILVPLLFNIYSNDIFLFIWKCQLCNYLDDNALYILEKIVKKNKKDLEMDFMILHK